MATEQRSAEQLRVVFARYAEARLELLKAIGVSGSNRDPLAEFSERIVAALLGGELAANRVQRGWDVIASGRRVQVKYLANPSADVWVNEHHIVVSTEMDDYAIVFYESLLPASVVVFRVDELASVGARLGKKHPNQATTLQLTRVNYRRLIAEPGEFSTLGVRVVDLRQVATTLEPGSP